MLRRRIRLRIWWLALLFAATAFFHFWPSYATLFRAPLERLLILVDGREPQLLFDETVYEYEQRIVSLETENSLLKRAQGIAGGIERFRVFTRVLWFDPDPALRMMHIAVPDGVTFSPGDTVIAPGDLFVGTITDASSRVAVVRLADDASFRVSVNTGQIVGVAQGNGNGGMTIEFVAADETLPPDGTAVRTAGFEGSVPKDLFLGWLKRIPNSSPDPFATLAVAFPLNFYTLQAVFVLPHAARP